MRKSGGLLSADALAGIRLAISVSESADLDRLGLLEEHFRLAVAEIARCIVIAGGHLAYGGHLQPEGYTAFLVQELERYSRRDETLLICLAWHEHRGMALGRLTAERARLGLCGKIVCLDIDGHEVDPTANRAETPEPDVTKEGRSQALTNMRRYVVGNSQGRVLIGGKRYGFEGAMPGLLEEAVLAVQAGQPIFLAGGFGGVASDIARALSIDDGGWFPSSDSAPAPDDRLLQGIATLIKIADGNGRKSLENGLTPEENRQLAASHRASEIAALVSLGLGRRFAKAG